MAVNYLPKFKKGKFKPYTVILSGPRMYCALHVTLIVLDPAYRSPTN
jgi:hypothetical protein